MSQSYSKSSPADTANGFIFVLFSSSYVPARSDITKIKSPPVGGLPERFVSSAVVVPLKPRHDAVVLPIRPRSFHSSVNAEHTVARRPCCNLYIFEAAGSVAPETASVIRIRTRSPT